VLSSLPERELGQLDLEIIWAVGTKMTALTVTVVIIAMIYFMIISKGFRVFALIALLGVGAGVAWFVWNNQRRSAAYDRIMAESEKEATSAIARTDLVLCDVEFDRHCAHSELFRF
jgi:hypothetical protein